MKVYMTYEFSDYGLWDTRWSKIFYKLEDAEAYCEMFKETHGWYCDICEFNVE
jgi:hypothetical protein